MFHVLKIKFYYASVNFDYLNILFNLECNKQKGSTQCGYYLMHWMSTIVQGGFKDNQGTLIVYFKTNSISYNCYYIDSIINLCVLLYHATFYLSKTIGTRENEDNSHSVGKILFES